LRQAQEFHEQKVKKEEQLLIKLRSTVDEKQKLIEEMIKQ
jgi:hypothetical protein